MTTNHLLHAKLLRNLLLNVTKKFKISKPLQKCYLNFKF